MQNVFHGSNVFPTCGSYDSTDCDRICSAVTISKWDLCTYSYIRGNKTSLSVGSFGEVCCDISNEGEIVCSEIMRNLTCRLQITQIE